MALYDRVEDLLVKTMAEHKCDKEEALRLLCAGNPEFRKTVEALIDDTQKK